MKKIFFLAFFAFFSLVANAQNDGKYEYFIEVYLEWGGKNYIPNVFWEDKEAEYIYDSNGEKLKFKSRSGVINFFTKKGWSFVQEIYSLTGTTKHNHLLLKKQVKDAQEAKEGLIFKDDLKK